MTFKRKSAQELIRPISDDGDELIEQQQRAALAARKAELKGAMIVGGLYAQKSPGTFATEAYKPQRPA